MTVRAVRHDPASHAGAPTWSLVAPDLPGTAVAEAWASRPAAGALVSFRGVVRDHAPGHTAVAAIDYEAYDVVALERLSQIADLARATWLDVAAIALWHRTGLVGLGEPSVQVTVSAGHRAAAFDAARFCIDVLKASVPVWKREHAAEGVHWSTTGVDATSVAAAAAAWLAAHDATTTRCGGCS